MRYRPTATTNALRPQPARSAGEVAYPATLVPSGLTGAAEFISRFLDAGFSKFVVRPAVTPDSWPTALEQMAEALLPLQN